MSKRDSFCPYVGLQPYNEADRDFFFGRERDQRVVSSNLYAASLTVLYGASGVGKSSVLMAGVVPRLRSQPRTAVVVFREWQDRSFISGLKSACLKDVELAHKKFLSVDPTQPLDELLYAAGQEFRGTIIIILDQFEEYFLYHPDGQGDDVFDVEFARSINRDDLDAHFLVAMREDGLSKLDRFRARIPNLMGNMLRLRHLDAAAAEDAIRKPLKVYNDGLSVAATPITIEDQLVRAILTDKNMRTAEALFSELVGIGQTKTDEEFAQIETPLLQLVMTRLWNEEMQRHSRVLRLSTLEDDLGGVKQIAGTHLDSMMATLSDSERKTCAEMFRFLVTPKGAKIAHATEDLISFAESPPDQVKPVLKKLDDARVLRRIFPPERYEIFHDVLAPAVLEWRARYVKAQELANAERRAGMFRGWTYGLGIALLIVCILFATTIRHSRFGSCLAYAVSGFLEVSTERSTRFLGKVEEDTARCRGGEAAVKWRETPWLDWPLYSAAGDVRSPATGWLGKFGFLSPDRLGLRGALIDLEYQRIELLKFNLFDNSGTYENYLRGRESHAEKLIKIWPQFRLPNDNPAYAAVGAGSAQKCTGELIRFRTLTGICNDVFNPLMGAVNQPFGRNVEFETTFPDLSEDEIVKNRHSDRLGLLKPDPQVISRRLFTRAKTASANCLARESRESSADASCDYQTAAQVNVLAAFWIQFMTNDWFSHLEEGRNQPELVPMGCRAKPEEIAALGCRPEDRIDKALVAEDMPAPSFALGDKRRLSRAPKTTLNKVTAWWDGSQIYGYDEISGRRVKRDPRDPAKLLLEPNRSSAPGQLGYLPLLQNSDPQNPQWAGQEAVAFPDNWNIGLSFFHNVFAREHNLFVEEFRRRTKANPDTDSGLRNPAAPDRVIRYRQISSDELFEIARLVISAEIAKTHTIEWTTQLLYNEPLYLAMNANWSGLLQKHPVASAALGQVVQRFASAEGKKSSDWYAAFSAGPGIFGLGNDKADISSGVNHFGSPFNFPEEFINAYRLHPMIPDVIEIRELRQDANAIRSKTPVVNTVRGKATAAMRNYGIANWALSMGRQRAGTLTLRNHPLFLQNLEMPRLKSASGKIDVLALDILRDRERGMPRYNEYRRQYGLKQLASFDDFIDPRLALDSLARIEAKKVIVQLREIYGQHKCDAAKIITTAQKNADGSAINDCLGRANGSVVDNIEDVDAMVGWLAEFVRPHGFAISETQFQVFILNASRRLFSDRFLTSSFRPEFYTNLGVQWINDNGPDGKMIERGKPNGHEVEVSPLKRVLLRTIPELKAELDAVINVFDPWARDRGEYYSLQWKPRPGAESDVSFGTK